MPLHYVYVILPLISSIIPEHLIIVAGEDDASKVYTVDENKYNEVKDRFCKLVPAVGKTEDMSVWSNTLTTEEIRELAFLNMGYGLTADAVAHLPIDLGWRKILIDQISYIARTTCDTPAISSMFLTGTKNLFLYYMIKYEKMLLSGTDEDKKTAWAAEKYKEIWTEIINALSNCAAEIEPIAFQEECGFVSSYIDSNGMIQNPTFITEQFDVELNSTGVDVVVDSVWWMFSTAYARCYSYFYPNEDIILLFLQRFREDVIKFFAERWRGAGEFVKDFEIIFGPINALRDHESLRVCATSAYDYEGLEQRHLVRPVVVTVMDTLMGNFKLTEGDDDNGNGDNGNGEGGDEYEYGI